MNIITYLSKSFASIFTRKKVRLFGENFYYNQKLIDLYNEISRLQSIVNDTVATVLQIEDFITSASQSQTLSDLVDKVDILNKRIVVLFEIAKNQQQTIANILQSKQISEIEFAVKRTNNNNNNNN